MPEILNAAIGLVDRAAHSGILARMLGSIAVSFYGDPEGERPRTPKDIDLLTLRESQVNMQRFLSAEGWHISRDLLLVSEMRETYTSEEHAYTIDVYYDYIDGNHKLDLTRRIDRSYPAISFTDLLLSKLQRHLMRNCDIWDCCALLRSGHAIEEVYLDNLLSRDWGFFTSAVDNLSILHDECPSATARIQHLLTTLRASKKSLRWHIRALLGRRIKWWTDMYDSVVRT